MYGCTCSVKSEKKGRYRSTWPTNWLVPINAHLAINIKISHTHERAHACMHARTRTHTHTHTHTRTHTHKHLPDDSSAIDVYAPHTLPVLSTPVYLRKSIKQNALTVAQHYLYKQPFTTIYYLATCTTVYTYAFTGNLLIVTVGKYSQLHK